MNGSRYLHWLLLAVALACCTLPSLGATSLWDMDEGVNAECAREMMDTGSWIVPTYNYDLRTAKPVMLYWLQRASYNLFGISEWSARLPSVLMALGTLILVYELGRAMFGSATSLLGGFALATCIEFVKLAQAATPDSVFIFFSTLTLALFWFGSRDGRRWWFVPTAVAAALAVLTKGPAGVALPGLVILLFLLWNRELKRLLDRRFLWAGLAFLLVAAPWYGLVTAETRGAYMKAFFGHENVNRFLNPQENHRGPVVYYLGAIIVFFAPWSIVLAPTVWNAFRSARSFVVTDNHPHRLLLVWVLSYLVFFSFAATKLPNYIAPLYPALALLTADYLRRWSLGEIPVNAWIPRFAAFGLMMMGVIVACGLLVTGGAIPLPMKGLRVLPDLAPWAVLGFIPLAGSVVLIVSFIKQRREWIAPAFTLTALAFVAMTAAFPIRVVDAAKAPKSLVAESGAHQPERDIRLASLDYTQESMTFYAERRVERLRSPDAAVEFLAMPRPGYLFVPAKIWENQLASLAGPHRIAARRFDLYRNAEILVVTNEGVQP